MFFPDRIQSIGQHDRVLEIGPGGLPHPRADVFLEKYFEPDEAERQRGHAPQAQLNRQVVYYDGNSFPFDDHAFDYVICSHVIEHVSNIEQFVGQMQRIASRGYIEFPTLYYDFIYNIPEHVNLLRFHDGQLRWMPKADSGFDAMLPVQRFFWQTLKDNYFTFVDDWKHYLFQGFEWSDRLEARRVHDLSQLTIAEIPTPLRPQSDSGPTSARSASWLARRLLVRRRGAP